MLPIPSFLGFLKSASNLPGIVSADGLGAEIIMQEYQPAFSVEGLSAEIIMHEYQPAISIESLGAEIIFLEI